jgi:uncharacterized protein (DUF3820 family)
MDILPDKEYLLKFADAKMPFGKYAGRLLIDLPEPYVIWFRQKGFPKGELGEMFGLLYEIKVNGLDYLFDPFRKQGRPNESK